jgi:hypothetical protein
MENTPATASAVAKTGRCASSSGEILMPGSWKNRAALRLENSALALTVLPSGAHIADLLVKGGASSFNLMWEAPWQTSDSGTSLHASLTEQYGAGPIGKFFAGWTGHALCLDLFGAPGENEARQGMPLHGEAASIEWSNVNSSPSQCRLSVDLPIAGLAVERTLELHNGESVLRCSESVCNLRVTARLIHWVQHVTLGPPFLDRAHSRIATSAHRGITWPLGYEGKPALADDREFVWPMAPAAGDSGRSVDLSPFRDHRTGFVVGLQQKQERTFSWIGVINEQSHTLLAYVFCTCDFPWLAIWEENEARDYFPWNGSTRTCGLEFGTTPFPMGRKETELHPSRFGTPTQRLIHGRQEVSARWIAVATQVPPGWSCLQDIHVHADHVELVQGEQRINVPAEGLSRFLSGESAI